MVICKTIWWSWIPSNWWEIFLSHRHPYLLASLLNSWCLLFSTLSFSCAMISQSISFMFRRNKGKIRWQLSNSATALLIESSLLRAVLAVIFYLVFLGLLLKFLGVRWDNFRKTLVSCRVVLDSRYLRGTGWCWWVTCHQGLHSTLLCSILIRRRLKDAPKMSQFWCEIHQSQFSNSWASCSYICRLYCLETFFIANAASLASNHWNRFYLS